MRIHLVTPIVMSLIAVPSAMLQHPLRAAEATPANGETTITLLLHAGKHDRGDVPVSVLVDADSAESVWMEFPDGTFGRASVLVPGLLNEAALRTGKKELHFGVPEMAEGETMTVMARVSDQPVEGRSYAWTGEPRQSRRLSCGQCHQGLSIPTAKELWEERRLLNETGQVPPLEIAQPFPTTKGRDFRWHAQLNKFQTSACWQCHGRHMVEYEFGQSLDPSLPWAPDPPGGDDAQNPTVLQNVYHKVFRTEGDRTFSYTHRGDDTSPDRVQPCGIHYGFERVTLEQDPSNARSLDNRPTGGNPVSACGDILQQHAGILSEEAGKFIGRHCVSIDWMGHMSREVAAAHTHAYGEQAAGPGGGGRRTLIAQEDRQLTVKNMRGRNRGLALWLDFVSKLSPVEGTLRVDGTTEGTGFRFVPPIDAGTLPEFRESTGWRAITFVFESATYTAVCFNHADNPRPSSESSAPRNDGPAEGGRAGAMPGVGYSFSTQIDRKNPLLVHYLLWIQAGRMSSQDIQAMSNNFVDPVTIEVP